MDDCYFIGYPGTSQNEELIPFWDTMTNFPIARHAMIASPPQKVFRNERIRTTGTLLVSGMSLSGSSGSPVITPPMPSRTLEASSRPARLIGIMSGHFSTVQSGETFAHAGLSFLTKSVSIRFLIEAARARNWTSTER